MSKTMKKSIALMLVILQLIVLLPVTSLQAKAVDPLQAEESVPTLNPVIEGTVRFGSFNYTGDTANNRDGVDYVTTFYYSDDYFSPSAVNPNANAKTMSWSALEDPSMVTLSHDFTLAAFGTSEDTVPVDWSNKSKNGERFLTDCGFENIFVNSEFNQQTGRDTLGYLFGTKEITVWDEATQSNKTFTLVAVGVRGAGYGAEWASNLTIGDKNSDAARDKSYSGTYRHYGFDEGARKVLADLDTYTAGLSGDVKYWVVGYSRAGAIANLVAGDITKNATHYKTSMDNVYGYTFEAAAGALKSEDPNGTNYPNIHNIINAMDLVPRMSTPLFNHCRLGVDYLLPYYGNTTAENNTAYYNNMYSVLPTVAAIADVYNRNVTGNEKDKTEDAVITDSDPSVYPYNRTIQIKSFGITDFNNGFVSDVSNSRSTIAPNSGLYLDQFLDQFMDAFFKCIAWDYEYFYFTSGLFGGYYTDKMTRDPMSHEQQYVKNYQEAMRTLAYHALKQPGMGIGALDGVMDNAMNAIDFSTIWNGAGIAAYYGEMNLGLRYNRAVYQMIGPMGDLVNKIIDQTGLFQTEDLPEVHAAVKTIMPVLTWLYCEDHHNKNGEYLGTIFANVGTVLVTHIPEQGISWDQSLDDVFISDYREITLPRDTIVKAYEFRPGLEDTMSEDGSGDGALVATAENGILDTTDPRFTISEPFNETDDAGNTMQMVTIRYPGNLDVRFDVTAAAGETFEDVYLKLEDYAPKATVNVMSVAERDSLGHITTVTRDVDSMIQPDTTVSAGEVNDQATAETLRLEEGDVLHVMAWHGSNQVQDSFESTYAIKYELAPERYTVTWQNEDGTVLETDENVEAGTMPKYNGATPAKADNTADKIRYVFNGWTPELAPVTENVTYTATFTEAPLYYKVELYYDDAAAPVYTKPETLYKNSLKLTAEDPRNDGMHFSHWTIQYFDKDGTEIGEAVDYNAKQITIHPGVGGITVRARAIYSDTETTFDPFVKIIGAEFNQLTNKWTFTLTQSVPSGLADEVGFVLSVDSTEITVPSTMQKATNTFTAHVSMDGWEGQPLYVRAYLNYGGKTTYSDTPARTYPYPTA